MIVTLKGTGRLTLSRLSSPITDDDLTDWMPAFRAQIAAAPERVVICADLRGVNALSGDAGDKFVWMMRRDNPKVLRSAMLLPSGNAAMRELTSRLFKEAGNSDRRGFETAEQLTGWLAPLLTPDERLRVDAFLANPQA